jgi:hypothetical protein
VAERTLKEFAGEPERARQLQNDLNEIFREETGIAAAEGGL